MVRVENSRSRSHAVSLAVVTAMASVALVLVAGYDHTVESPLELEAKHRAHAPAPVINRQNQARWESYQKIAAALGVHYENDDGMDQQSLNMGPAHVHVKAPKAAIKAKARAIRQPKISMKLAAGQAPTKAQALEAEKILAQIKATDLKAKEEVSSARAQARKLGLNNQLGQELAQNPPVSKKYGTYSGPSETAKNPPKRESRTNKRWNYMFKGIKSEKVWRSRNRFGTEQSLWKALPEGAY
mmetsp:Transcript_27727/g.63867  ORF Transcript_27727/g.63867 Transcript_27727/m.63867 type:complete len:242 (+) Transcript_27727:46-771(+)